MYLSLHKAFHQTKKIRSEGLKILFDQVKKHNLLLMASKWLALAGNSYVAAVMSLQFLALPTVTQIRNSKEHWLGLVFKICMNYWLRVSLVNNRL